jgi:hypothetical protein
MAKRKQARSSAKKKSKVATKKRASRAAPVLGKKPRAKPLSLFPLSFEDVMRRLVKPGVR